MAISTTHSARPRVTAPRIVTAASWAVFTTGLAAGGWVMRSRHDATSLALFFAAWLVMVLVMTTPAFATATPAGRTPASAPTQLAAATSGWFAVWTAAGAGAWLCMMDAEMLAGPARHAAAAGAITLAVAGSFQLTPTKRVLLERARTAPPLPGDGRIRGAFATGARSAAICVGSCWVLMLPMVVAGATRPVAMALLAATVSYERAGRRGAQLRIPIGLLLVAAAITTAIS
jgi:predicted metal-binding membrane protein